MKIGELFRNLTSKTPAKAGPESHAAQAPFLEEVVRFPYGPFRFRSRLARKTDYAIVASTDLKHWKEIHRGKSAEETMEYIDSEAFKFPYRFYRLLLAGSASANVIGYASITLPPGFSMIANPFSALQTVA